MTAVAAEVTRTQPDLRASLKQIDLLEAIKFANASVASRPPMQVLLGVLIEGKGLWVRVSGFDYEQCTSRLVAGTGIGRALVPGRLLQDLVGSFDKGSTIELFVEGDKVIVESGDTRFAVPSLSLDDYPALPDAAGDLLATVPGAQLSEWLQVAVAAGRDQTLPVLTGIRIDATGDELEVAATDRYRLAVFRTGVKPISEIKGGGVLVPAKTMQFVAKQFAKEPHVDLIVEGQGSEGRLTFRASDRTLIIRLLDGEFPKYRSLLPSEFVNSLTFDSKQLTATMKRVALVAARNAPLRLRAGGDLVQIEAGSEYDASATASVSATTSGIADDETLSIAFNPAYALDGVASTGGKELVVCITAPTRPMVWLDPERPAFQYLLMPVRLAG